MKILTSVTLFFLSLVSINAQTTNLSGRVFDHNGAVVLGSKIHIKSSKEKKTLVKTPNDEGVYSVSLAPGFYSIEVQTAGFKKFEIKKYRIVSSDKMCLDIVLEIESTY